MTHYDNMDLVVDNVLTVDIDCDCGHPNGCSDCCGTRLIPQVVDLSRLLHNLAVAGALCEAHWQRWFTTKLLCRHWEPGCGTEWSTP
jgi:hypothetical protein